MALPPNVFTPVAQGLKKNVYPEKGIARLIVPPPPTLITSADPRRSRNRLAKTSNPHAPSKNPSLQSGVKMRSPPTHFLWR